MKQLLGPFTPQSLMRWDFFTGLCSLLVMVELGLRVFIKESDTAARWNLYLLDIGVAAVFLLDILVEFGRGYRLQGQLILDRSKVIANYSWWRLSLDLIVLCSLCLTLVPQLSQNYFRLPILWRFYHLGRFDRNIFMLSNLLPLYYVLYTLFKMILMLYLFCHFAGSLYFWVDFMLVETDYFGDLAYSRLWIYGEVVWSPVAAEKWWTQYMYSIYYTVETFTTVGYGDNTPRNAFENCFVIVFMICCAGTLAYIIKEIVNLFYNFFKNRYPYLRKQQIMRRFLKAKRVERVLVGKVLQYYDYLWFEERLIKDDELNKVLNRLPLYLRNELMQSVSARYLRSMRFFTDLPYQLYNQLTDLLQESIVIQGQTIFRPHRHDSCSLYMLWKNHASYYFQHDQPYANQVLLPNRLLAAYGEYQFFTGMARKLGLIVTKQAVMYELPRSAFIQSLKHYSCNYYFAFSQRCHQLMAGTPWTQTACESCSKTTHTILGCPKLHYVVNTQRLISKQHNNYNPRIIWRRRPGWKCKRVNSQKAESNYRFDNHTIELRVAQLTLRLANQAADIHIDYNHQSFESVHNYKLYFPLGNFNSIKFHQAATL